MRTSIGLIEAMIYRTGGSVVLKPGVIWGNHRLGDTTTRPCGWESWDRRSWILVERIPVNVTYKHVDNLNENEGFQVFSRTRLSCLFPPRGHLRIQGDTVFIKACCKQGFWPRYVLLWPILMHFSDIYHAHSTRLLIIIPSSVLLPCRRPMAVTTCFEHQRGPWWVSQVANLLLLTVFSQGIESWCSTVSLMYAGGKKSVFFFFLNSRIWWFIDFSLHSMGGLPFRVG